MSNQLDCMLSSRLGRLQLAFSSLHSLRSAEPGNSVHLQIAKNWLIMCFDPTNMP